MTLDTNVLVSGLRGLSHVDSTPGSILRKLREGRFVLITSEHIATEAIQTMKKPYFQQHITHDEAEVLRLYLANEASYISITVTVEGLATHPEDDLVLATAISGEADYLVTGDKGLLGVGSYQGVTILTPRAFLDVLENTNLPQEPS